MTTRIANLATELTAVADREEKIFVEVKEQKDAFAKLQEELAALEIPSAAQEQLDRIKASQARVDDLNPDEPEEPAPVTE